MKTFEHKTVIADAIVSNKACSFMLYMEPNAEPVDLSQLPGGWEVVSTQAVSNMKLTEMGHRTYKAMLLLKRETGGFTQGELASFLAEARR